MTGLLAGLKRLVWSLASGCVFGLGLSGAVRGLADRYRLVRGENGPKRFPSVRRTGSARFQVLLYHRVSDDTDGFISPMPTRVFENQIRYLASQYTLLTLEGAVEAMGRKALARNALVVTFDDGYRDNFDHAYPILASHGVPATIFLTTGFIGTGKILWHDRVFRAFHATRVPVLREFGGGEDGYELREPRSRARVAEQVLAWLKSLPDADRRQGIERLIERLEVDEPEQVPGLMLEWDQVREMARSGIEFGSHTVSHPILSKLPPEAARHEVFESKRRIEAELRTTVSTFAYPNGRRSDYDRTTIELLREAGFTCAVTTQGGTNGDAGPVETLDWMELRRDMPWEDSTARFAARLALSKFTG